MLGVRTHGLISTAVWRLEIIIIASGNFDLTPQNKGPTPPPRALMACYQHTLGALDVRHS